MWFQVNTINKYLPRPVKDYNWKIIYNLVNTNMKLRLMKLSQGKCDICRQEGRETDENLEHLLFTCPNSRRTWVFIQRVLNSAFGEDISVTREVVLSGLRNNELSDRVLLINMVIGIVR